MCPQFGDWEVDVLQPIRFMNLIYQIISAKKLRAGYHSSNGHAKYSVHVEVLPRKEEVWNLSLG